MLITPAGDRGLFVTFPDASPARLRAVADGARSIDGVVAAIVGHESVYVIGTGDRAALERAMSIASESSAGPVTKHSVEVSFAPEHALDLDDLIRRAALPREEIVERIAGITLTVRYLGFRAGFGYLEGWPLEWSLPRRPTSRNFVPGGSFAVAAAMAGFYPVDSPGGWNILGRTDRVPRFEPGDEVRIVAVDRALKIEPHAAVRVEGHVVADVISPGQLTTLVTPRNWKNLENGEPAGGPFDAEAASIANRAAGNDDDAGLLECVLVGPRLRFRERRRVAWCGPSLEPRVFDSDDVDIGRIRDGFRGYLAIEGGVSDFGKSVRTGSVRTGSVRTGFSRSPSRIEAKLIRILRGPHDAPPLPEWWEVTPHLNRVGIRLRPQQAAAFTPPAELPSCGMQFGTLQWHPDGSVVAMGPDHPATGGYLQPATVVSADVWKLAQLAPGEAVRLVE